MDTKITCMEHTQLGSTYTSVIIRIIRVPGEAEFALLIKINVSFSCSEPLLCHFLLIASRIPGDTPSRTASFHFTNVRSYFFHQASQFL